MGQNTAYKYIKYKPLLVKFALKVLSVLCLRESRSKNI